MAMDLESFDRYPASTDRVEVIVYCKKTGRIRQHVKCSLQDAHRHHSHFEGHDYLDVTGMGVCPHKHVVDLATLKVVSRTEITMSDRRRKENALREAFEKELAALSCGQDPVDLLLRAAVGEADAVRQAASLLAGRNAAAEKLAAALRAATAARTTIELQAICWP